MKNPYGQFTMLAILCLICGTVLTLGNIGIIPGVWKLWPVFPLFLGLGGIWFFRMSRELIPLGIGFFLVLISIFFFILNFTSWGHMSQCWPFFIGIFGISVIIPAAFTNKNRWFILSGFFFVFLSLVLFMVFTIETRLWPISLILLGIWLLLVPQRRKSEKSSNS